MFRYALPFLLICSLQGFAQEGHFSVNNLSKRYDVELRLTGLDSDIWKGKVQVSVFNKNQKKPFQTFYQKSTYIDTKPTFTTTADKANGKWSDLYIEDLNFDGFEDIAVPDGLNGGYSSLSYQVYLFDPQKQKFVFNAPITRLAHGVYMGIPVPDRSKKTLSVFWKETCCEHFRETYKLVNGRTKMIAKISEYYNPLNDQGYEVTQTEKLINGKWRTWTKRKKIEKEN